MLDKIRYKNVFDLASGDYFVQPVPQYLSQFSSRELVSDFLDEKLSTDNDPKWKDFGFLSIEDYSFWSKRLCGIICLKMVLDTSPNTSTEYISELTSKAVKSGGYIVYDEKGAFIDNGWFYQPLVNLAQDYGFEGKVLTNLKNLDLCNNVLNNIFTIISVHPGVIRFDFDKAPNNKKGGHLVLVVGFKWDGNNCTGFYIHNPSGRVEETQEKAFIPIKQFDEAFALRGFSLRRGKINI